MCLYCDAPAEHLDHIVPLSRGGSHAVWNWAPLCATHNLGKWASEPEEFLARLKGEDPSNPKLAFAESIIYVARRMHEGLIARGLIARGLVTETTEGEAA